MKKLKAVIALMLVFLMVFSLAACGKKEAPAPQEPETTQAPEQSKEEDGDSPVVEVPQDGVEIEGLETAGAVTLKDLVGHYEISHMEGAENDVSDEELALMKSLGMIVSLDMYEDGRAILTIFDETIDMTYDLDSKVVVLNEQECMFRWSNNVFELVEGESTMSFIKVSDEPGPLPENEAESLNDLIGDYKSADEKEEMTIKEDGSGTITIGGKVKDIIVDMFNLCIYVVPHDTKRDELLAKLAAATAEEGEEAAEGEEKAEEAAEAEAKAEEAAEESAEPEEPVGEDGLTDSERIYLDMTPIERLDIIPEEDLITYDFIFFQQKLIMTSDKFDSNDPDAVLTFYKLETANAEPAEEAPADEGIPEFTDDVRDDNTKDLKTYGDINAAADADSIEFMQETKNDVTTSAMKFAINGTKYIALINITDEMIEAANGLHEREDVQNLVDLLEKLDEIYAPAEIEKINLVNVETEAAADAETEAPAEGEETAA